MEYGVIGEHLPHSFSKEIHRHLAEYDYQIHEISPDKLAAFLMEKSFYGINVTIPYKKTVIPYLQHMDADAESIGVVNTIICKDDELYGYNTDIFGLQSLVKHLDIQPAQKKVLILGTGGTSATAQCVMRRMNAGTILCVSRHPENGEISYSEATEQHGDAEVIVNTTPVGMYPNIHGAPIDLSYFPHCSGVVDVVYNPLRTDLVLQATDLGIPAAGGLYMLVAQAAKAASLFLGNSSLCDRMDAVYQEILCEKQSLVLIGMPGCGKSTIGRLLAQKTGKEFYDTDDIIIQKAGMPISRIFNQCGEKAFRDMEQKCIAELSLKNGAVIATGGGAILRPENVHNLKKNGQLLFLDRPLEDIIPTEDRPLSANREELYNRAKERMPLYRREADRIISVTTTENTVLSILERK